MHLTSGIKLLKKGKLAQLAEYLTCNLSQEPEQWIQMWETVWMGEHKTKVHREKDCKHAN